MFLLFDLAHLLNGFMYYKWIVVCVFTVSSQLTNQHITHSHQHIINLIL